MCLIGKIVDKPLKFGDIKMSNIVVSYKEGIIKEAGGLKQISLGIAFKTDKSNEIPKEEL